MLYAFEMFGVMVFSISGALVAGRKDMDVFGVVVVAVVTALGGGTLRDVALNAHPLVWIENTSYLVTAVVAGFVTFIIAHRVSLTGKWLPVCDAIGLAIFTVMGTEKAFTFGVPAMVAVVMGVMSGVAGGILRDVLCNEVPLIFRKELYATPALCGGVSMVLCLSLDVPTLAGLVISMGIVLILRFAGIYKGWSLPVFRNPQS